MATLSLQMALQIRTPSIARKKEISQSLGLGHRASGIRDTMEFKVASMEGEGGDIEIARWEIQSIIAKLSNRAMNFPDRLISQHPDFLKAAALFLYSLKSRGKHEYRVSVVRRKIQPL